MKMWVAGGRAALAEYNNSPSQGGVHWDPGALVFCPCLPGVLPIAAVNRRDWQAQEQRLVQSSLTSLGGEGEAW